MNEVAAAASAIIYLLACTWHVAPAAIKHYRREDELRRSSRGVEGKAMNGRKMKEAGPRITQTLGCNREEAAPREG